MNITKKKGKSLQMHDLAREATPDTEVPLQLQEVYVTPAGRLHFTLMDDDHNIVNAEVETFGQPTLIPVGKREADTSTPR